LVSVDPYAVDIASTIIPAGLLASGPGQLLSTDAIWFSGIDYSVSVEDVDDPDSEAEPAENESDPVADQTAIEVVPLPQVSGYVWLSPSQLRIDGRNLESVVSLSSPQVSIQLESRNSSSLVVNFMELGPQLLDLELRGGFGIYTLLGVVLPDRPRAQEPPPQINDEKKPVERRALFRGRVTSGIFSIQTSRTQLLSLASAGAAEVTCTGFSTGDLSKSSVRRAALDRARKICLELLEINPELKVSLLTDKKKYFGRSVHVVVSSK
jgi:hypothetical protein